MLRIIIFLMLITVMVSCKKEAVSRYEGANALAFYRLSSGESDSLNYSFSTVGFGKQADTLFVKMRVVGSVENYDRPVQLRAVEGTTARANVDYKLPESVVPAGTSAFLYPVVVYKTPEMKTQILRLIVEAAPNNEFPGVVAEGLVPGRVAAENTVSLRQMKIDITDKIIRPGFWNATVDSWFGTYSEVKYVFMIEALGTGDFSYSGNGGKWTANDFDAMLIILREALAEYKADHGPLIDENGTAIEF